VSDKEMIAELAQALEYLNDWHGRKCGSGKECKVYRDNAELVMKARSR